MNPILEETALPTTTSNPDTEPTYVLGTPISARLDRMDYEYEDERSVHGTGDEDGGDGSSRAMRDDDALSLARTFGVRSRAESSLRHQSSFDSSLRQVDPTPSSPVGLGRQHLYSPVPPIPPRSAARSRTNSYQLDRRSSDPASAAGPSRPPSDHSFALKRPAGDEDGQGEADGDETPRSTTPASSFYAKPHRRQPGQIAARDSSLGAVVGGEALSHNGTSRISDEGFDSRSNSTGSHSLRSQPPIPVDANLRSMPGVVGLGDGWAGGPQNQKKRRLWFMKKPKSKPDEDPLALWAIQENGTDASGKPGGEQKKGIFKEAWNRSISKFGSMPALVSGDHLNGNGAASRSKVSVRNLLSRSRLDLSKGDVTETPTDVPDSGARQRKSNRRSLAMFGLPREQEGIPDSDITAQPTEAIPDSLSPPSPSPASRSASNGLPLSSPPSLTPMAIPDHDTRRLSMPLSASSSPGGLPPPWRPQSFILPRPEPSTPAPQGFSRFSTTQTPVREDSEIVTPASQVAQSSLPSSSAETPIDIDAAEPSLQRGMSDQLGSEASHTSAFVSRGSTPAPTIHDNLMQARGSAATPTYSLPRNTSTPGFDTLEDWAAEGKRPSSRAIRPLRSTTPRSREPSSQSQQSSRSKWGSASLLGRLKQALAVPETPPPRQAFSMTGSAEQTVPTADIEIDKELPDLPSRTSTPLDMPGAFPLDTPRKQSPLPASPYDITQAVAQEMLATSSPSRSTSRQSVRKRGLSGDMWSRRLSKISETNLDGEGGSRASSRQEKRRSYSALAGRLTFTKLRRNSGSSNDMLNGFSALTVDEPAKMPALDALEFGEDDLGLDDILDENRRISLVRDLEASLPLPPARDEPSLLASPPKSIANTISSSEATVLAAPIKLDSPSHRSHPSTSTVTSQTSLDRDDTIMTPEQLRRSLDKSIGERRGSPQSDEVERMFSGQSWPTRGHRRGASMGSIVVSKRVSVISDGEDDENLRHKEREERTMSFASGVSSLSSAMSLDDEEAIPMSAVRVASPQQHRPRQIELGSPGQGIRA